MLKVWLSRWLGMGEVLDYAVQVNKRTAALEHKLIELEKRLDDGDKHLWLDLREIGFLQRSDFPELVADPLVPISADLDGQVSRNIQLAL